MYSVIFCCANHVLWFRKTWSGPDLAVLFSLFTLNSQNRDQVTKNRCTGVLLRLCSRNSVGHITCSDLF